MRGKAFGQHLCFGFNQFDSGGDACDKCPLDVGPECTAIDPYTGETVYITDGS